MAAPATDVITHSTDREATTPAGSTRLERLFSPFWRRVLTALGFAVPVAGVLVMIASWGLNVIVNDQWADVTVIKSSYGHFPDWSVLWQPHNENRIFFPNLMVVALAHLDHFDITVEEFLGAAMLIVSYFLFILAHRRRSPSTPWLYYCPVMLLGLCITQWGNLIWGFQTAWFVVMLALAVTVYVLDGAELTWPLLAAAIVTATVGSYSSLQGLTIWAAGLVLLYYRRRSVRQIVIWLVAAALVTFWYFYNLRYVNPHSGYARHHLFASLKFFIFELGDIVGVQYQNYRSPINYPVFLFGIFLLALAVLSWARLCGLRRDTESSRAIGVALIVVSLLFSAMVVQGRAIFAYLGASFSRYTTVNLLLLVGIYFILLPAPHEETIARERRGVPVPVLRWAAAASTVTVLVAGTYNGMYAGHFDYQYQVTSAQILRHYRSEPPGSIGTLYIFYPDSYILHQARIAQSLRLSLFAP